jgi:hypothetical protein
MDITGQKADMSPVTFDQLLDALESMPKDPIAEWMKDNGFDPDKGCKLVLPASMRSEMGLMAANYMMFSMLVSKPMMMNPNWVEPKPVDFYSFKPVVIINHPASVVVAEA